jgi:hypothetical protein
MRIKARQHGIRQQIADVAAGKHLKTKNKGGGKAMAGGYTHVTLAQLAVEETVKRNLLSEEARQALQKWKKFVIIGSMGPDYAYLDITDKSSEAWGFAMHEERVLDFVREAVRRVRGMQEENVRQKCAAWLFGFASHCVADGVIHPVINLKVGPYQENKTEHRCCELSQDVLVHAKLGLGPVELNRQLSINVQLTADNWEHERLDRDIARLWSATLATVYAERLQKDVPFSLFSLWTWAAAQWKKFLGQSAALPAPDPNEWHRAMRRNMKLAESGGKLMPFARHAAANLGLTYPEKPEPQYVKGLKVPQDSYMEFEAIFSKALQDTVAFWQSMSSALQGRPSPLDSMAGWNLATGFDQKDTYVFWS